MFSQRSIRKQFIFQILVASAALLIFFSSILYFSIRHELYIEKEEELLFIAQNIQSKNAILNNEPLHHSATLISIRLLALEISTASHFEHIIENGDPYLVLYYPYTFENYTHLVIKSNISSLQTLLSKILRIIFVLNSLGILFVILYAVVFANMLLRPIRLLTHRFANMNENFINAIETTQMPQEFQPLADSINKLIKRIQTFIKYQKELFIGTAHELKTPLAVIKLKNDVTLIKERTSKEYIDAIKTTNESISTINKIIAAILNVGRQEGAQFEPLQQLDLIELLKKYADDFNLIAKSEQKILIVTLEPTSYIVRIQPTLVIQVIQNFLQNALKFSPKNGKVFFSSKLSKNGLEITVIDDGCGIDESMDLFAPFKRAGDKSGAGLGLFLAKSAADALHATIIIENRKDAQGTKATLILHATLSCLLPIHVTK